jgi:hypothetical protein
VDRTGAPSAAGPTGVAGQWLTSAPGATLRLAAVSLAVGLVTELAIGAFFGGLPVTGVATGSFFLWLVGVLVYANGGAGLGAWFLRWLVLEVVLAWLARRVYRLAGAGADLPPLLGRWVPLFGALAFVAVAVMGPVLVVMAAGLPVWLALVLAAWPLARLVLLRPIAVLEPVGAWGAVAASWRRTRRRDLYAGFYTLMPLVPVAGLWLALYLVAAYLPGSFVAAWWLAVALFWLYIPFVADVGLALFLRLSNPEEV